ncbi:MAG: class I SAM-dependent methyltransferase [Treponema sp.]|jgi:2-polyprenyl-3-methyl-5-hydroxy-6-metoxy-1,4-benzoquinol methylase|nr:class I SAM-dependent methyltransferase [Treponema sp.]
MNSVKTWSTPVNAEESRFIPCALCGSICFRPALACEGFSYVRCTRCGLVQMNPQPSAGAVTDRYTSAYGKDYLAYELENERNFLRLQELALRDAGFEELEREWPGRAAKGPADGADGSFAPRVLDVGCATGALLEKLRDRGWKVCGLEISPSAEYARNTRDLDVRSLSLENSGFGDGSFDVVLASHLIEHLNDPALFVREAGRVLAPGGRLFVTTPNISGLQARFSGGRWRSAIFDHLYLFSAGTLSALLVKEGFRPEKTATWGGLAEGTAPPFIKRAADRAAKRFGFGDVMIMRAAKTA